MIANQVAKALGVVTAIVAIAFAGMLIRSPRVQAQDDDDDRDSNDPRIEQGFDISPVKLDLDGKNRRLVGLGSYIVNAQGDCNGCHTNPEFASGGNPYFLGQKKKIDPKTFL